MGKHQTSCRNGHPRIEGSFARRKKVVDGKTYTVIACLICHRKDSQKWEAKKREKRRKELRERQCPNGHKWAKDSFTLIDKKVDGKVYPTKNCKICARARERTRFKMLKGDPRWSRVRAHTMNLKRAIYVVLRHSEIAEIVNDPITLGAIDVVKNAIARIDEMRRFHGTQLDKFMALPPQRIHTSDPFERRNAV